MASGAVSSSVTNTSAFEYDEIETNGKLKFAQYRTAGINDAITQPQFDVNNKIFYQNDAFMAGLQAIDPQLVELYKDRDVEHHNIFFWLRLPQPSRGTACLQILSLKFVETYIGF